MSEQRKPHGPYESSAQAFTDATLLNTAIHAVDPGYGPMTDKIRAARLKVRVDYLTRALTDAGVELGEYDRRIAAWLAEWETETLQVVVGWLTRAHDAGRRAVPACSCGCPPGGPCGCVTSFCSCNPCPVCDWDQDADAGGGGAGER